MVYGVLSSAMCVFLVLALPPSKYLAHGREKAQYTLTRIKNQIAGSTYNSTTNPTRTKLVRHNHLPTLARNSTTVIRTSGECAWASLTTSAMHAT